LLHVSDVHFGYHKARPVLRGVSCQIAPGAVTVIVGPNGCGKSTLLRLMLGTLCPLSGSIRFGEAAEGRGGRDVASFAASERAARLAFVAQRPEVWADYTVAEVAAFGRFALGASASSVQRALVAMQLADRADESAAALSEGQRQRVSLARVLAQFDGSKAGTAAFRAVLADEPISAMDPRHAIAALGVLRAMKDERTAVVLVLHDLTLALRFGDAAIVLAGDGTVAASGPIATTLTLDVVGRVFGTAFERHGPALIPV